MFGDVRLSVRPLNLFRYLLLGFTTQELHFYTICSPRSKVVSRQFSGGSRQKFGGDWRKTAKNVLFRYPKLCRYLLLGYSTWKHATYTI